MSENPLTVLVIDDDPDVEWMIRSILENSDFQWQIISLDANSDDIIKQISDSEYDILLIDHHLGSITVLEIIKSAEKIRLKPILAFTSSEDSDTARAYLENGAIGYLVKSEITHGNLERSLVYAYRNWANKKILTDINQTIALNERLSTASVMAQGISHQYNNGLAIISANTELLERKSAHNPELKKYLYPIQATIDQLNKLTKRMSSIFNVKTKITKSIVLNHFITSYLNMTRAKYPHISFDFTPSEVAHRVQSDVLQLQEVFDELIQNAAEAMWSSPEKSIYISVSEQENTICIEIKDTGIGIRLDPEEVMRPFKTTKGAFAKNSAESQTKAAYGLGLTLAQGLLFDIGGTLTLHRNQPTGTSASINLPKIILNT